MLSGPLGAGKTALAKGIAIGVDVEGPVNSPTFVLARLHRARRTGHPAMVHVDFYRLLDTDGLDLSPEQIRAAVHVSTDEWAAEGPQIQEWFDKLGDTLPAPLLTELDGLRARLGLT